MVSPEGQEGEVEFEGEAAVWILSWAPEVAVAVEFAAAPLIDNVEAGFVVRDDGEEEMDVMAKGARAWMLSWAPELVVAVKLEATPFIDDVERTGLRRSDGEEERESMEEEATVSVLSWAPELIVAVEFAAALFVDDVESDVVEMVFAVELTLILDSKAESADADERVGAEEEMEDDTLLV